MRPTKRDESVMKAAARELAPKLKAWAEQDGESHSVTDTERDLYTILSRSYGLDGFELAREAERLGWVPDAELVDILDGISGLIWKAHRDAVAAWVRTEGIAPARKVGDVVPITHGGESGMGEITRVEADTAHYLMYCGFLGHVREGVGTHGIIVPFEQIDTATTARA